MNQTHMYREVATDACAESAADKEGVSCPVCAGPARYDFSGRDLMFDLRVRHDYYCCDGCGTLFQHPMPDEEAIASFYPASYNIYDEQQQDRRLSPWRQATLRRKKGYAQLQVPAPLQFVAGCLSPWLKSDAPDFIPGGRMLDVGCGNGRYLATMRALGWQVEGVEFSEDGVRVCRKAGLPVHHGDLASAGLPDAAFDLVTARHVIEHIPTPHPFMAELARVLKPGGHLIIETPNSEALGRKWFGTQWFANEVPRHLFLFSPHNLVALANRYGLTPVALVQETTPKIFLNSLDYVIGNRNRPSRKIAWRRLLARIYVWLSRRSRRGDTFRVTFAKS